MNVNGPNIPSDDLLHFAGMHIYANSDDPAVRLCNLASELEDAAFEFGCGYGIGNEKMLIKLDAARKALLLAIVETTHKPKA